MIIRLDGKDYDLSKPSELAAFTIALEKSRTDAAEAIKLTKIEADKLQARLDAATTDLTKLRTDASDTKRFDAAVAQRVELEGAARTVLGTAFDPKGKTDRELMVEVVRADAKEFKDDGKSDDYVRARFDTVLEKGVRADSITTVIDNLSSVRRPLETVRQDSKDAVDPEKSRLDMLERNANAWRKPATTES